MKDRKVGFLGALCLYIPGRTKAIVDHPEKVGQTQIPCDFGRVRIMMISNPAILNRLIHLRRASLSEKPV